MNAEDEVKESKEAEEIKEAEESTAENIANWIITIAMAVMVIFIGYAMICTARGRAVSVFGKSLLKVVTGSMEPTILTGDFIIIEKTDTAELETGDIIAYYSEDPEIAGSLVTHRIVEIRDDGSFITKGDANTVSDLPVRPDQVAGRYIRKARLFKWIGSFADRKKLLLLLVIIPMFFIALYEAVTMTRLMKEAGREIREEKAEQLKEQREERIRELREEAIAEYLASENKEKGDTDGKEKED